MSENTHLDCTVAELTAIVLREALVCVDVEALSYYVRTMPEERVNALINEIGGIIEAAFETEAQMFRDANNISD